MGKRFDDSLDLKFGKGQDNLFERVLRYFSQLLFSLSCAITRNMLKNPLHFVIFPNKRSAVDYGGIILTIKLEEMIVCEKRKHLKAAVMQQSGH